MRKIRLAPDAFAYLQAADFVPASLRRSLLDQFDASSEAGSSILIDDAVAEGMREIFTERLALVGFDDAYELSPEGLILEELIDIFSG